MKFKKKIFLYAFLISIIIIYVIVCSIAKKKTFIGLLTHTHQRYGHFRKYLTITFSESA